MATEKKTQKNSHTQDDRVPHSTEAENAVIASCLIDKDCYPNVRAIVSTDDFFSPQAKEAFAAFDDLWPNLDQLTVSEKMGQENYTYLSSIVARIPTSVHAEYYAEIVRTKSYQRKLINACLEITQKAYEWEGESSDLFINAQELLNNTEPGNVSDIIDSLGQVEIIKTTIDNRKENNKAIIEFPYRDLTALTGGMSRGNLIIIGARPGIGKSQLLIETGLFLRKFDYSVMVASAEMGIDEWSERELAILTGVTVREQRTDGIEKGLLNNAIELISKMDHYWLTEPITISKIINKARVLNNTVGIDILIVDYIQLIADTVSKEYGSNIRERVGFISRSLKRLAKELNIVVLAAAQLNRDVEMREDKRPRMSDIKESGDIEQDADIIILPHRPSKYDKTKEPNITHLYVPKIRQIGDVGDIRVLWNPELSMHVDITSRS